MRQSLTFRLVAWYCALLLVLGAGFGAYTTLGFTRYIDETSRQTLAGRINEIWRVAEPLLDDPPHLVDTIKHRFEPESRNRLIRISLDGRVLYVSDRPVDGDFDPARIGPPGDATGALRHEPACYVVAQGYTLPDGRQAIVEAGLPDTVIRQARRGLTTSLLVALPIFLTIAACGGFVLVHRVLAPVSRMIAAAEALSFNSPAKRLPLDGTLEPIASLGQSLNRMLDRLDNAYQHVSQFSAETAHELRTPMAIVHGELELIQAADDLPEHLRRSLAGVLQETTRLGHIVESLITIARMGSIWGKQAHLPTDLQALAGETVEHMRLLAEDKGVALTCPEGADVTVPADRNRLKQVLVNLIDNAVKFTPGGGQVTVAVSASANTACVTVTDTGIGIAPEHHARIFDRSFRLGGEGAGLGLAIARSICAAHGGTITLASDLGQGASFRVELPRGLDAPGRRPRSVEPARSEGGG